MYERFTDRACKVMQLANQEAQRFNHEYIGTEHILLGLLKEGSGAAADVLRTLEINLHAVRLEIEKIVPSRPEAVTAGKLPETPRAKKVIECAVEEARGLGHAYIGTEHLLLGLLHEGEGVAAQILMNLGLRLDHVRREVFELLGRNDDRTETIQSHWYNEPVRRISEFDLYLTLQHADGAQVEPEKIVKIRERLRDRFGGLVSTLQKVDGTVTIDGMDLHGDILVLRVLSEERNDSAGFIRQLIAELRNDLKPQEILLLERRVKVL